MIPLLQHLIWFLPLFLPPGLLLNPASQFNFSVLTSAFIPKSLNPIPGWSGPDFWSLPRLLLKIQLLWCFFLSFSKVGTHLGNCVTYTSQRLLWHSCVNSNSIWQIKKAGIKPALVITLLYTSWHQLVLPQMTLCWFLFLRCQQAPATHLPLKRCTVKNTFLGTAVRVKEGGWASLSLNSKFARKSENNLNAVQLLCWDNRKKWQLKLTGDPFVSFVFTTIHSEHSTAELQYWNIN